MDKKKFLNDDLLKMTAAAVLGRSISLVAMSFVNDFIEPLLNQDFNGDGTKDISQLKDIEIVIFNTRFKFGHFIVTLMTVCISILILYWLHGYNYVSFESS